MMREPYYLYVDYLEDDYYDYPVITYSANDLEDLEVLFQPGYLDIPFTKNEEEMLPIDSV
jgi:hypothetical protein